MSYPTDQETANRIVEENGGIYAVMPIVVHRVEWASRKDYFATWQGGEIASFSDDSMDEFNPYLRTIFSFWDLRLQIVAFDYWRHCYYVKRAPRVYYETFWKGVDNPLHMLTIESNLTEQQVTKLRKQWKKRYGDYEQPIGGRKVE